MKYIDIPFGPYLPDFGGVPNPQAPGYLVDAINIRSTPNGYRVQPTLSDLGVAVGSNVAGTACVAFNEAGYNRLFAVTVNTLGGTGSVWCSADSGATWTDVTPASNAIGTWPDFVVFGDDIYASYWIGGTLISRQIIASQGTDFASVADSPNCLFLARVRDHLVAARITTDIYSVQWSAIGDPTDWPTPGTADARAKQAGTQALREEFGVIRRIVGGEKFGLIFQTNAITRMTYVGGSAVYEFDTFERKRGAGGSAWAGEGPIPVATDGVVWYWLNEQGLWVTDGYSVRRLSSGGSIENALFVDSISHDDGPLSRPFGAGFDERRNQIIFNTRSGASSNRQLVYNLETNQFSFLSSTDYRFIFDGNTSYSDSTRVVYNFNSSRVVQNLAGSANGTIALQTGYLELEPGYRVQIQKAHLLGTGVPGDLTLSYKTAATLDDVDTLQTGFTAMTAVSRGEGASARIDAPYVAFRVTGTGAESQLIRGIRIFYEKTSQL